MSRINMEVDEDVKLKWKEHSQGGDKYANMSHFIRTAVENQIKFDEEYDGSFNEAVSGAGGNVEEQIEDLKQDLNETLISLQSDINRLQVQAEGTENETLLSDLMSEFHDILPRTTEEAIYESQPSEAHVDELVGKARKQGILSSDIQDVDARKALEELTQKIPTVETAVVEGERYYYEME